jgi:hypothetical protein
MIELSGLELRRAACEALGWSIRVSDQSEIKGDFVAVFDPISKRVGCWCLAIEHASHDLPEIESDPAVSEPMFLEWCEKNKTIWTLKSYSHAPFTCELFSVDLIRKQVSGSTPSEARARAIVAAKSY